ncbi:MAG: nitrile hydratase accessory protein [Halobacteriales archaeon]|nr:nitrile hydratase accessory protein [Halobacteriales archaeon]
MTDTDHAIDPTEPDLPGTEDAPTFHAPWQARAFAIAVALTDDDADLDWQDFQRRLVEMVQSDTVEEAENPETVYYRQWLGALERLLVEEGLIDHDEFQRRAAEFAAGDRDASEFVEGDRGHTHDHDHDHSHSHGHGHGHGHDHGHH